MLYSTLFLTDHHSLRSLFCCKYADTFPFYKLCPNVINLSTVKTVDNVLSVSACAFASRLYVCTRVWVCISIQYTICRWVPLYQFKLEQESANSDCDWPPISRRDPGYGRNRCTLLKLHMKGLPPTPLCASLAVHCSVRISSRWHHMFHTRTTAVSTLSNQQCAIVHECSCG